MIIIEGIIGAGKTTLAEQLHDRLDKSRLYREPVDGNPYLEKFYADQERWGLEMQYYLLAHRYQMHEEAVQIEWDKKTMTIFDRSIYGDWPFAKILHDDGLIKPLGFESYMQHRECMEEQLLLPQYVIYLDVPVNVALERIAKRGRACEKEIQYDYLSKLKDAYEIILTDLSQKTNVLRLDWPDGATVNDLPLEEMVLE